MQKQKKAIIALSSVCVVFLVALITVVSIWAATSQTVSNQLTVRYTATNVAVTVSAHSKLGDDGSYEAIGSAVTFEATDSSKTETITAKEITLTDDNNYVVFRYTFVNNGSNTIYATINTNAVSTTDNVTVTYATGSASTNDTITGGSLAEITIAGNTTVYAFIKVAVTDQASDALYSGTLSWNLSNVSAA